MRYIARIFQEILPPVRSKNKKKSAVKENKTKSKNSKRIKSYDYASWEKFDPVCDIILHLQVLASRLEIYL